MMTARLQKPTAKRDQRVMLYLTEDELALLEEAAERREEALAVAARELAVSSARLPDEAEPIQIMDVEEDRPLLAIRWLRKDRELFAEIFDTGLEEALETAEALGVDTDRARSAQAELENLDSEPWPLIAARRGYIGAGTLSVSQEFRSSVAEYLHGHAHWRSQKAEEYPEDHRNQNSAEALREAATYVDGLPLNDPRLVTLASWGFSDALELFGSESSAAASRYGFRDGTTDESDADLLLTELVETAKEDMRKAFTEL